MSRIAIILGAILVFLGVLVYFGTGQTSITALIPAFFGLPLFLLGLMGLNSGWRKHAMHLAAGVALLGFVGAVGRPLGKLLAGTLPEPSPALLTQLIMAVLCGAFVILAVKSFIDARRQRA